LLDLRVAFHLLHHLLWSSPCRWWLLDLLWRLKRRSLLSFCRSFLVLVFIAGWLLLRDGLGYR
jgi:hypothetical protein